jgi:hypothetical protein
MVGVKNPDIMAVQYSSSTIPETRLLLEPSWTVSWDTGKGLKQRCGTIGVHDVVVLHAMMHEAHEKEYPLMTASVDLLLSIKRVINIIPNICEFRFEEEAEHPECLLLRGSMLVYHMVLESVPRETVFVLAAKNHAGPADRDGGTRDRGRGGLASVRVIQKIR